MNLIDTSFIADGNIVDIWEFIRDYMSKLRRSVDVKENAYMKMLINEAFLELKHKVRAIQDKKVEALDEHLDTHNNSVGVD